MHCTKIIQAPRFRVTLVLSFTCILINQSLVHRPWCKDLESLTPRACFVPFVWLCKLYFAAFFKLLKREIACPQLEASPQPHGYAGRFILLINYVVVFFHRIHEMQRSLSFLPVHQLVMPKNAVYINKKLL